MSLGKIRIGRPNAKRNKFDFSHTVSTTFDFGSIQPTFCKMMMPEQSMSVKMNSFVRCSPLVVPTFADISLVHASCFVPMTDIFPAFESLLANKTYEGSQSSYIPSKLFYAQVRDLTKYLLDQGTALVLKADSNIDDTVGTISLGELTSLTSAELVAFETAAAADSLFKYSDGTRAFDGISHLSWPCWSRDMGSTITVENADYMSPVTLNNKHYLILWRFNNLQKRLRKILLGLGYQLDMSDSTLVSTMPIFAMNRAYYELYAPKRITTWFDTDTYKCLNYFVNSGTNNCFANSNSIYMFKSVLAEASSCFYTYDNDIVSSYIDSTAQGVNGTAAPTVISFDGLSPTINSNTQRQPYARISVDTNTGLGYIDQARLNMLQRFTKFINKSTVLGARIQDYLKGIYGSEAEYDMHSCLVGVSKTKIQISDVTAQSNSTFEDGTAAPIGTYTGKGTGSSSSQGLSYTAKAWGYWITLSCVIPERHASKYWYQGIDQTLTAIDRFSLYQSDFDALGFETNSVNAVKPLGAGINLNKDSASYSLGYIPRYSNFKVQANAINGDLSLPGMKNSGLQSYDLAPKISDNALRKYAYTASVDHFDINYVQPADLKAGESWRYCMKSPEKGGNYNRIFFDEYGEMTTYDWFRGESASFDSDNFISHIVIQADSYAPMLPMSESFDTDENANNGINVEHQ